MVDWDATDVKAWKEEAREKQQMLFLGLGDREWDESEEVIILKKVGFALYDLIKNLPDENDTEYIQKLSKNIGRIPEVILENSESSSAIHFACIFVFGKIWEKRFNIPVFKVKGKDDETLFVDLDCRVYKSWRDYLDTNHLPKCLYCYPRDGLYQGNEGHVLVDFGTSPACNLNDRNSVETTVGFPSTSMLTSLFVFALPLAVPFLTAVQATSVDIGMNPTTQSVTNAVDRQLHNQSIGPRERESMLTSYLTVASALATAQRCIRASIIQSAAAGEEVNKQSCITYDVVLHSSLTVNSLDTLDSFFSLVDKADKGNLTQLDVFQFSASVLFFSKSILLEKKAEKIIENTQIQVLTHHCRDLTAQQIEEFFKLLEKDQGKTQLIKNANTIKAINNIKDKQSFYESLVTIRSDLKDHQVQFSFEEPGLVNIDNELHIAPNKLVQISKKDRQMILDATQREKDFPNDPTYWRSIEIILRINRVKMQYHRRDAIALLKKAFETDNLDMVKIGNEQIFKNMTPSELDRLADVMAGSGKNYDPKVLKIANEFVRRRQCKTLRDYSSYVEFTAKYLSVLKNEKEGHYQIALKDAKKNGKFDRNRFDREYGIRGRRAAHFENQVFDKFDTNPEESFKALEQYYTELESDVLPCNAKKDPNFEYDTAAVYHYFKHSDFGGEQLTAEQYFDIASELVNEPLNKRSAQLNQQGDRTRILFTNPINGAKGVVIEKIEDGKKSLATVFYDDKVLNQ